MNIVDQQTFRDAMSCMGAAVNIITTDGPARAHRSAQRRLQRNRHASHITGVPESWGVRVWPVFNENRTLCVNTLSAGQEPLSNLFGGKTPMEHRFAAARWQTGVTGCPQLEEALVSFDCRISQVVSVGTHDILFCAIEAIHRHATPYGLVWFDRSYHALMRPAC